jgi:hypothetical protein
VPLLSVPCASIAGDVPQAETVGAVPVLNVWPPNETGPPAGIRSREPEALATMTFLLLPDRTNKIE